MEESLGIFWACSIGIVFIINIISNNLIFTKMFMSTSVEGSVEAQNGISSCSNLSTERFVRSRK